MTRLQLFLVIAMLALAIVLTFTDWAFPDNLRDICKGIKFDR